MTTIISGPGQSNIGEQLAKLLKADLINIQHKFFPDGERDLIFSKETCDEQTIIVQSIVPPQDSNLISLLQMAYTAQEFGAKDISLVTPYLAYAAKDRRILPGEVVSIFNIFKMIEATPAKRLFVVDIHNPEILLGKEDYYHNFSAMSDFGRYFLKKNLDNPLVLAPDVGAKERVAIIGKVMNAETDYFDKKRDPISGEAKIFPHEISVKNRDVIIADELIRTGGTIVKAIQALQEMNVGRIFVASTHMMLVNDADKKILAAGAEELIGTDSLPSEYGIVPVAPMIKDQLNKR